ncbi:P-loop containing nucleoside triphosphate hydrolase protein [Hymenopellis radicata]|nr:P-loop containing nucleoside triphosphate hydrolase protein [Hymenopellis radicata]
MTVWGLFWRQLSVLFWKNSVVLFRHPLLNAVRCFLLPVGYGIFLSLAQTFLSRPNNNGLGDSIPIYDLQATFTGQARLIWTDATNDSTSSPSPQTIISRITRDFTPAQLAAVKQLDSPDDIPASCPQNFNLLSECFAAVIFHSIPGVGPINYTIRADAGVAHIDVVRHTSDFELRVLPLQWAIDKAIIESRTGQNVQTPMQWPFTQATNEDQDIGYRLKYIRGLRKLLVLALFVCYIGIAYCRYQLPGAVASERASLITAHMKAMGLLDSAKVISWHLSLSLVYLPAWVLVALIWHHRIFTATHVALIILVHVLLGLVLASWSFFVAAPFGKSPQLAAVASTFLAIVFAMLALIFTSAGNVTAVIFTVVFPPGFYIFAIRAICGFENNRLPTNLLKADPDNGLYLLPLVIAAVVDIFLWPWLSVLWEYWLYGARNPKRSSSKPSDSLRLKPGIAIAIKNLGKTFSTSIFRPKKNIVTAVDDLTFDIPKFGIFVLLGSNGAGKSTTLSILAGLTARSRGIIQFENGEDHPERGTLGIVPQKNVLFPELTCHQTLRVWRAIKWSQHSQDDEDIAQLLKDCDLGHQIHAIAETLSGGQKRKLQLAIGLVGGSKIVLVDECTSGVDPLSRRSIWRTLTSVRHERTIVFTTHFLDEADLLADNIAMLAAPGKLVAQGSPVGLKRDLGDGYTIQACIDPLEEKWRSSVLLEILDRVLEVAPGASMSRNETQRALFHLRTQDPRQVQRVLRVFEENVATGCLRSYDILGTTIEDVFLDLMSEQDPNRQESTVISSPWQSSDTLVTKASHHPLELSVGRPMSPWQQATTIFVKRTLVARRSWLAPLLSVLVAVAGATIPLIFLNGREPSCTPRITESRSFPLYMPISPFATAVLAVNGTAQVLNFPPGLIASLGDTTSALNLAEVVDNTTFVQTVTDTFPQLGYGGISMDVNTGSSLIAWEASSPGLKGAVLLNLVDNILYNDALRNTGFVGAASPGVIQANYEPFPLVDAGALESLGDTLEALKWATFFGAAMSVYTAFFAMYVAQERGSAVQAMQFSNGLSDPIGLWLGHLSFDVIFSILSASIIVSIFAFAASDQFHGLGLFWLVLVLYGVAGTLLSYCFSLLVASPLGAFAASAGYQAVMFLLYLAGYLLTLTYAKASESSRLITIIHFCLSVLSPVASVERAAFVSINLFSLLCADNKTVSLLDIVSILRFGGPLIYLSVHIFVLLGILIRASSGSLLPRFPRRSKRHSDWQNSEKKSDVHKEARNASTSADLLRVLGVSKTFNKKTVVDDVSLSASSDTIFALLGPNGAGKTTTFNMIRGDVTPDAGDILIAGESIMHNPKKARFSLGVCPQFTAVDSQLTVKEHLQIYGRLKGLGKGTVLHKNVQSLLGATGLLPYADRLASKLSGGNQRKLSLAIALMGNPSVILIDEFSTGVDAKMKRDMWVTLKNVVVGKAVVITTHSMEEASVLANKVGILSKCMLAVGTVDSLSSRYATYEVHFTCRTPEESLRVQVLMSQIPGSRRVDDVATRFEVPIHARFSLAQLFHILSSSGDFSQFTVEKASLESTFLKVIRENDAFLDEEEVDKGLWA